MAHSLKLLVLSLVLLSTAAMGGKPGASVSCYRSEDPVSCLQQGAKAALQRVSAPNERADAIGELLYALAETENRDEAIVAEAARLAASPSVAPARQVDLLYAIDLYRSADGAESPDTFAAAVRRFAQLERELSGHELLELYVGACSIIAWDDPFQERWSEFMQGACTPEKLRAVQPGGVADQALLLTVMPVAMTLAENRVGYLAAASLAQSWLAQAQRLAGKSGRAPDRDFAASFGVLIHIMNSFCLDAFDEEDASDDEIRLALASLRRLEKRVGITGRSTFLRRPVVESLFKTGHEAQAGKMLREMLARVDADAAGKRIPLSEQVAILALAARLEYGARHPPEAPECVPEGMQAT